MTHRDALTVPRLLLLFLGIILLLVTVTAGATSTTPFGAYTETWEGASELRQLGANTNTPTVLVRNVTEYPDNGSNSLAIILSPARPYNADARQQIATYVQSGGTLLIAEDYRPHSNALLAALDTESRFTGHPVRDEHHYHRSPAFPIATNLTTHPLTNESSTLTLNHGTTIRPATNATPLARTSGFAYLDRNRNEELDTDETLAAYPVVTIEAIGDGHLILVSDPSLFINAMLERDGNAAFANALFHTSDRVLIDTSHAAGELPPLRLATLLLRTSPSIALLLASLSLLTIGLWERRKLPAISFRTRQPRSHHIITEEHLITRVASKHPEWDRERIERVVQALMSENEPEEPND